MTAKIFNRCFQKNGYLNPYKLNVLSLSPADTTNLGGLPECGPAPLDGSHFEVFADLAGFT